MTVRRGAFVFMNMGLQSDLVCPNSEKPESPLSDTKLVGTDFTPLIRKPRCPTPTRKFRNGYIKSIEKKR